MPPHATADIRLALPTDVPALTRLVTELGYPATTEEIAARLDALLAAGEIVLVAARDGDVIGLLTLHVTPVLHRPCPVGRLTLLVVAEEARGVGAGRVLVEEGERRLAEMGCGMVEVTSNRKRTEAHAFYQRLGYEATSLRLFKPLVPPA